jgi:diguanylate cyclase (GGDEF)-like protein
MVDDDSITLEVVRTYLEEAGYSSFVTTSEPKQAMRLFEEHRPDILLLDLNMPEVTGFDILSQIRAHEELRYVPVIILTAETDSVAKLKALDLGATDLLTKPVDPSELRLRLRNALAFKAYQDRLSDFDALTGLPNRKKFRGRLADAVSAQEASRACALFHVDLDRFKQINDTLGHRTGDRLLCAVARLLEGLVTTVQPSHKTQDKQHDPQLALSRISGNGFAVLLPGLHNLAKVDDATNFARRIQNALVDPIEVDGRALRVTASIGIAVSPGDGADADTLLKHAEVAMYQAKRRGRKSHAFFSSEMNAQALERMTLESELRRAVERGEFVLYFQPRVDMASGRICGAEALVRWKHPSQGMIPPAKFIPIAEETGLIVEIGQWVLREACMQIAAWTQQGIGPLSVSVNVSPVQFSSQTVWHAVRGAVERSRIPPRYLVLELTESLLIDRADEAIAMMQEVKAMGVSLAIDDFGTGYSSFSYLSRLPMDELKIDQSFVKGLPQKKENAAIVGAILALGKELGLKVVAEGVDAREQLQFLAQRGCQEFQGYLCSRPAPAELFERLARRTMPQPLAAVRNG